MQSAMSFVLLFNQVNASLGVESRRGREVANYRKTKEWFLRNILSFLRVIKGSCETFRAFVQGSCVTSAVKLFVKKWYGNRSTRLGM